MTKSQYNSLGTPQLPTQREVLVEIATHILGVSKTDAGRGVADRLIALAIIALEMAKSQREDSDGAI